MVGPGRCVDSSSSAAMRGGSAVFSSPSSTTIVPREFQRLVQLCVRRPLSLNRLLYSTLCPSVGVR